MATLSALQVAAAAYIGGFRDMHIAEAVAVAKAESDFNPSIYNGICCTGLWQINWPVHKSSFPGMSVTNPADNAKMAYKIWTDAGKKWGTWGGGGNPWEAYGNGRYQMAMPSAVTAMQDLRKKLAAGTTAESILGSSSTPGTGGTSTGTTADQISLIGDVTSGLEVLTNPHTWLRVGTVVIGLVLVAAGLGVVIASSKRLQQAASVAVDFVPGGGAVKKVAGKAKGMKKAGMKKAAPNMSVKPTAAEAEVTA